jgi:hypothetical protein
MIDPLIVKFLSVALGLMLAGAAWHKLAALSRFTAVLADYRLLPASLVPPLALLIPAVEILLAAAWLTGIALAAVAPLTAAMFAVYALAIAINLLRGRVHISCGCGLGGASTENQALSWTLVFRNALLFILALLPLAPVAERAIVSLDWLTLIAALVSCGLLYFGGSQLLQNGSAIRSWRNPRD